ncbi:hypothetical protein V6N11_006588 [Hibiscus sabdariffa]|uniref:Polygalacturonase n=1 Tax=Hibiscus sabdariffa TaxID=183260 RepID=A0ABR2RRF7_9ROSI
MFLKTLCLPLLFTLTSLCSCFGSYTEEPFHVDGRAYHPRASYRPYFRTFGHVPNKRNYRNPYSGNRFGYDNRIRSELDGVRGSTAPKIVNVDDFGAKANGGDDSQAFRKAWNYACSSSQGATMVVPKKTYRLKPINFSGPCKSPLVLKIYGTIKASTDHSDYEGNGRRWLYFDNVQNLRVEGGGTIDGNGRTWWEKSCKINKALPCKEAPTVSFSTCLRRIIGSLGAGNSAAYVSNVIVNKATLSGTSNGVRIKTWQGGSGYARNIKFQNIVMNNVSAVQVSDVLYQNIRGTSASGVAMKFDCSRSVPCRGIYLQNVALRAEEEDSTHASCANVRLSYLGDVSPPCSSQN